MKRALGWGLVVAMGFGLGACVIIVRPNDGPTPTPTPTLPLICTDTLPNATILVDLRVQRASAELAPHYRKWIETTAGALALGAQIVTTQAVLVRAGEQRLTEPVLAAWGCNLDDPRRLTVDDVIRHYAVAPVASSPSDRCAVDNLVDLGRDLTNAVTSYPSALPAGTSGLRIFGPPPDVLIVLHIDDRPRLYGFDEPPCAQAAALAAVDDQGDAAWLDYATGGLPADRVVHWFVTTDELVGRDDFVRVCKEQDGLPANVLDHIDPSPKALYGPLAEAVASSGAQVARISLCSMLVDTKFVDFMREQIHEVADLVGQPVDEEQLEAALAAGGLPSLEGEVSGGQLNVPGRR